MKRVFVFLKKKDLYLGFARYVLGLMIITYALTKILRTQFVVIPFSLYQRPLESLSSHTIAWAFLGYSPWFQVLLGFFELVPSILLLFRRTTLLGAILMLPMTLSVFLINHALNLWDATKTISLVLFILNLLVLIFEWGRIREIFGIVIGKGIKYKWSAVEICISLVLALAVSIFTMKDLLAYKDQTNVLTGDWYNKHPREWTLQSEKINDSTLKPRLLKWYFGAYGEYSAINDTGYIKRDNLYYDVDEKKHLLNFYDGNNKLLNKCTYALQDSSILKVERIIDSAKNTKLTEVFKMRIIRER